MAFVWPTSHIGMLHPAGDKAARTRAEDFLSFAQASVDGVPYDAAKELLACSTNQAETRKSLFEELGLLFVPYRSNRLVLTPLGRQFAELLAGKDLDKLTESVSRQASALLIWALCRVQINRPQSRGVPRPADEDWKTCNVKPYAAAWLATRDLGGKLYLHELIGALRGIHQVDEYPTILDVIRTARKTNSPLADKKSWEARGPEMNYAIYWRSHLSVAEQLMTWDRHDQALIANPALWDIVDAALRFQSGCAGNPLDGITGANWSDPEDYFMNLAGAACPPFLATGAPKLTTFDGEALADLRSYEIDGSGTAFTIRGGPELCNLKLKLPCFHPGSPKQLLRIDDKYPLPGGMIELKLGKGRPITSLPLLEKALGKLDA